MKYRYPHIINHIKELYAMDRSPQTADSYSKGRFTLKEISQRTGVKISSVYKIVKNI